MSERRIRAASAVDAISKCMTLRRIEIALMALERETKAEEKSILRRERRVQQAMVTARKIKTRIKIVVGAEALRLSTGEITESEFLRIVSDGRRQLEEIDRMLAGLRPKLPEKSQDTPAEKAPGTAGSGLQGKRVGAPELPTVAVKFWERPPDELKARLRPELGLRFDGNDYYWRGKSDPETVEAMIRASGQWHLVRDLKITFASSKRSVKTAGAMTSAWRPPASEIGRHRGESPPTSGGRILSQEAPD